MEVCGGQTHSIIRNGIDQLLDGAVEFIHGPGCPVCVTPLEMIDRGLEIASREDVIFCSFGDMLRVPGSRQDLFSVRARGGDVRIVYSPLDATRVAAENPDKEVVFFGVGFETTAPANAMSVLHAQRLGPDQLLGAGLPCPGAAGDDRDPVLADQPGAGLPGRRARLHRDGHLGVRPAGREVRRADRGHRVRAARPARGRAPGGRTAGVRQGRTAQRLPAGGQRRRQHRGPAGPGRRVRRDRPAVARHRHDPEVGLDAVAALRRSSTPSCKFGVGHLQVQESAECHAGEVLQGLLKPNQCPAFGKTCTPRTPLGATMVSSEGACAAYYQFRRLEASSVAHV